MGPSGRGIAALLAIALASLAMSAILRFSDPLAAFAETPEAAPVSADDEPAKPVAPPPKPQTVPPKPPTFEISGVVELREKGKRSVDKSLLPRNTVVVFEPSKTSLAAKPVGAEMSTVKKEFNPRLLVVPVGSTVRFPNLDPILHNVFSISGRNSFDLGLLGKGPGKLATFREAGIVRVFCNVHHGMFAYVFVVASPHWTTPGEDGRFRMSGLPAGQGKLTIWNERSAPTSSELTVPVRSPLTLGLEITMPRIPPHKNKLGRSYGGANYG